MARERNNRGDTTRIQPRTGAWSFGICAQAFAGPARISSPVSLTQTVMHLSAEDRALLALNGPEDEHDIDAHIEDRAHEGRDWDDMLLRLER